MSNDGCPRCGLESSCPHGSWPDRHPAAAVTAGLFALVWMSMMFSVYPVASLIMTGLGAAVWGVRAAGRERRRREALSARADYEHRALMAVPLQWPQPNFTRGTWGPPRRPVDHRATTEPMRMVR